MVHNTFFEWMGGKHACSNSHQSLTSKQMFSTHEIWRRVTRLWQSCGSMIFIFCRGRWFSGILRSIAKVSGHQKSALNNDNNWPFFYHIYVNHPLACGWMLFVLSWFCSFHLGVLWVRIEAYLREFKGNWLQKILLISFMEITSSISSCCDYWSDHRVCLRSSLRLHVRCRKP